MAVDACSEDSSPVASPRLSFSHDLTDADMEPAEPRHARPDALLLNPIVDFDFCLGQGFSQQLSSADEIFADGKILPVQIKKIKPPKEAGHSEARKAPKNVENATDNTKKKRLIEFLSTSSDADDEDKPSPKPFWQFRRSSSLNCDHGRTSRLLRSLQFLTRSNSTGSAPNQKASAFPKPLQKQHSLKDASSSSAPSSYDQRFRYDNPWKRSTSLRKSNNRRLHGNNGVGVSPVLNITPTSIAKGTASLFGFGSFLCSKKSKKKKKFF